MSPFSYPIRTTPTSSALIPFLPEFGKCGSIAQAAEVSTRILVEEFGADVAMVKQWNGPLATLPDDLSPTTVSGLSGAPAGVSAGSAGSADLALAGLRVAAYPVRGPGQIRVIAAWKEGAKLGPEDVRSMSAILTEVISRFDRNEDPQVSDPLPSTPVPVLGAEQLLHLVETIPAVVYVAEMGEQGRWHYVSPQIEVILGYRPEEWVADPGIWLRSIHPADRQHALSFEDERLLGLDFSPPAEYRMMTRDGQEVWIYERARLLENSEGKPVWHGILQDISALKSAELELTEKARQQILVAQLGEMAIRGEDPDKIMRTAAEWIGGMDRILEASVWEQEGHQLIHVLHRSGRPAENLSIPISTDEFPGRLLIDGKPVVIRDWNHPDPRLAPYRKFVPVDVLSSVMSPILGSDQQFGLVLAHSDKTGTFTEEDGNFLLAIANVIGNALERSRTDRSMQYRMNHDALTDLPNRRMFTERLIDALAAAKTTRSTVGLLFLDLDHFKLINDAIGHHAGDEVLREIAPRLSRNVRQGDTVARFGGDEFAIVLTAIDSEAMAWKTAERILTEIAQPIAVEGGRRLLTASIGIAIWNPEDQSRGPEDLIREADAAMYQAKESGRARIQVFGEGIQKKLLHRLEIEDELHHAVDRDELAVAYQPVVELENCELIGFEALVRWHHPVKGLLSPADFIPVAEESDLIRRVDSWVLRQAIAQAARWNREIPPDRRISISVNCSSRQIRGEGFTRLVADLLEEYELAPGLLTLEITETILLTGDGLVDSVLDGLVGLGVRLALDDFGTGFSSLGSLGEFPLDEVKIDRQFIEYVAKDNPRGPAIIDAVVRIGKALSLTVVAEAISTESALDLVRELGCHAAQGYLIAKPLTVPEATELIARPGPVYPG